MAVAEEEWAGRGTVRAERDRDSGWAAEEPAEAAAGREVREAEAREREARAEAGGPVRAEVCGIAELAEARVPVAGRVLAQARVRDLELAEVELDLVRAELAGAVARVEVGERERARVEVEERARVEEEERARVEEDSAEVGRVRVLEAEELVAEVVRVVELERAERERRENG